MTMLGSPSTKRQGAVRGRPGARLFWTPPPLKSEAGTDPHLAVPRWGSRRWIRSPSCVKRRERETCFSSLHPTRFKLRQAVRTAHPAVQDTLSLAHSTTRRLGRQSPCPARPGQARPRKAKRSEGCSLRQASSPGFAPRWAWSAAARKARADPTRPTFFLRRRAASACCRWRVGSLSDEAPAD